MSATGRRTKFTPEVRAKIIQAIESGNTREAASGFAGIDDGTLYTWLRKGRAAKSGQYREFLKAVTRAESRAEVGFVNVVAKAAKGGDWKASQYWLSVRKHRAWSERYLAAKAAEEAARSERAGAVELFDEIDIEAGE